MRDLVPATPVAVDDRIDIEYVMGLIGPSGALRVGWSGSWTAEHQRLIHQIYMSLPEDMFRAAVRRAREQDLEWRKKQPRLEPERWSEEEHAEKQTLLTWKQQKNLWDHMDAGNAFLKGELTREQHAELVRYMEPLPKISDLMAMFAIARAKARLHHIKPQPGIKKPPQSEAAKPVTKEQLAESQARVDRLRAMYPDATAGQILSMLEKQQ